MYYTFGRTILSTFIRKLATMDLTPDSLSNSSRRNGNGNDNGPGFVVRGLQYGFVAGLVCAEVYLAAFALFAMGFSSDWLNIFIYGQLFGVLPGIFFGAITGMITGFLFEPLRGALQPGKAALLGLIVAFFIFVPIALVLYFAFEGLTLVDAAPYLPIGALYLLSGAIGGWRLVHDDARRAAISPLLILLALAGGGAILAAMTYVGR
jgi:hypothetical protein